jgi:hypothetical protein
LLAAELVAAELVMVGHRLVVGVYGENGGAEQRKLPDPAQ